MASTMIHLLLARKIKPNGCGLYFMGSFAPDIFDSKRSDIRAAKNENHFRNVPNMEEALKKFYLQIDKSNPFHEGYFVHLICDMWWYDTIDKFAEDSGNKQVWYDNLKNEYRATGIWIRRNMPWVDDVFHKMEICLDDFQSPMSDPTNVEIISYKNNLVSQSLRDNDAKADGKRPEILTPEFLEDYADEVAERYKLWVAAVEK